MDSTEFWQLIDAARARTGPGVPFDEALVDVLAAHSPREILEYQERFDEFHWALYRWEIWAAAHIIGDGCSDDGFIDFRAGVVSLGRTWYERVVAAPDSLADHPAVVAAAAAEDVDAVLGDAVFDELVNYAAPYAFERLTGDREDFYEAWEAYAEALPTSARADLGERFAFEDAELHRRLPRLAALFLDDLAG